MNALRGTGVALVTPFTPSGAVDISALHRLVNHVIEGEVDFLVILGTTGESATLNESEKALVTETIIESNGGRIPYVIGCGGNNTAKVCQEIGELGAKYAPAAFLSVSPYYNKPTQAGLYEHFKAVSNSTDRDIILYNVPGRTAMNMQTSTSLKLARELSNITAIKDASGDLEEGMDLVMGRPDGFRVLSGDDTLTLAQIGVGFEGVISVAANAIPRQFTAMVNAALAGDYTTAQLRQYEILKLMRLFFAEGNPAGVKAGLETVRICGRSVRLPLIQASDALSESIAREMRPLLEMS
ncbi:UNVERIFIED_CONTAM: hypothetical protein GTU68_029140 [Idotea baltica]|nr:hypothetical protein [Idotea baltica]